jgi:MoaA/NifB/PqqE/SkfB family radical SAM enzyme|tara:strand:+ start:808 stop:1458 length:651 start_codon:yes stop_codon:yes gene_type:complete
MIVVDVNITNLCNARCPQCQRTDRNGLGIVSALPLTTWSLNDFKKKFNVKCLEYISEVSFCGTWGDPLMAKDIEPIVHYIIDNSKANVMITTNGSIRTDKFYWDLGVYCGRRLSMVIDVDGIDEQMHQKYRRGTSLKKSLEALQSLSQTKAIPLSQSIIFKHNEDYKDQMKELALLHGSHFHQHVYSEREGFDDNNKWHFINEKGQKEFLEKSTHV